MAPVTIQASARSSTAGSTSFFTAHVLLDTGSELYAVAADSASGGDVRVLQANSYPTPASFAELDSANNKTQFGTGNPHAAWLHTDGMIHVAVYTALNTYTHYRFDTSTGLWTTGHGTITAVASPSRSVRLAVRSDGDVLFFFTSSADTADLGYFIWQGANWSTGSATGIFSGNTTEGSTVIDAGIDSTDRTWVVYYDAVADDVLYRTINSANTVAAAVTIEATGASTDTVHPSGARFNMYVDGTTDKIIATYLNSGPAIDERTVTLESDANSANLTAEVAVEATSGDVGTHTALSTAVLGGVPYAAWWDDASSGTIKYSTKSGGTWAAETNFATSITRVVEIAPVDTGLAVTYQSGTDLVMDWIVAPSGGGTPATLTVTAATAPAAGEAVTLDAASNFTVTPAAAPADGQAVILKGAGTLGVTVATAPAAGEAVTFDAAALFTITPAAAPAQAEAVNLAAAMAASLTVTPATASASGEAVTLKGQGALAVTPATAPAAGEAVTLDAAAVFTVTAATAPAAGGNVALAGQGALAVTPAAAPAGGEAVTFDAAAKLTVTEATAPAAGGTVNLAASAAAALTVTPATAPAQGEAVTLDAAAKLTAGTATAPAQGEAVTLDVAAVLTVTPATAPAAGGAVTLHGQGRLGVTEATAPAAGENVALSGGTSVAGTLTVAPATAPAQAEAVTFDAAAVFAVTTATAPAQGQGVLLTATALMAIAAAVADATGLDVSLTGRGTLAIAPPNASAAADGAFTAAARFVIDTALADALADGDLTGAFPGDIDARLLVGQPLTATLQVVRILTGHSTIASIISADVGASSPLTGHIDDALTVTGRLEADFHG